MQGELAAGNGGEHGRQLHQRDHYRLIYETPEIPSDSDLAKYEAIREELGVLVRIQVQRYSLCPSIPPQ